MSRADAARWIAVFAASLAAASIWNEAVVLFVRWTGGLHGYLAPQFTMTIVAREAIALAVVWTAARRFRASPALFGLVPIQWRDIAFGILFAIVFVETISPLVDAAVPGAHDTRLNAWIAGATAPWRFATLLAVGVFSPLVQELVFRGVLLRPVARFTGAPLAVLIGAVLFALVHFGSGLAWVVNAFAFGLAEGAVFFRFRSLIPCLAMHVTTNTLTIGALIAFLAYAGR